MASPKHTELACIKFNEGRNRFCLDRVNRIDEDDRVEYALIWRGNKQSPNGFNPKPGYFTWELFGQLLQQAVANGSLSADEIDRIVRSLTRA